MVKIWDISPIYNYCKEKIPLLKIPYFISGLEKDHCNKCKELVYKIDSIMNDYFKLYCAYK